MSDLAGLVSVKDVVKETIWMANKGEGFYKKFLQHAINGFREMNKHHYKNTKREKLTMDSNYIIPFPNDMVLCVNIYVPVNGVYKRLSKKDDLVDTTSLQAGVTIRDTADGEGESIQVNNYGMGAGTTNIYGYYTEDKRNARFIFMTNYRTEVIIDYITNGISSSDDLIPTSCKQALQAWMLWQDSLYDRNYNLGEKKLYFDNWDTQSRMLTNFNAPSLQELSDEINSMATLLPTR
jgi:hypothetical protein